MKLIIDIPDEDYNVIIANANFYKEQHWGLPTVWDAIIDGVPLPKGHGDLIDRNVAYEELSDIGYGDDLLRYVPTVIKADK